MPDPRRPGSVRHKLIVLLVYGTFLFLWQCASRREGNRELTQPSVVEALQAAFPQLAAIPHMDTVARVLEALPADELEATLLGTMQRLLRNRKFAHWMVEHHYLVAIDGTLKWTANYRWAEEALEKHHGTGDGAYQAYVLEAVLVGPQGIAIPLLAEFCENPADAPEESKQDSELKAFYRLARRLKAAFPRLPMTILLDGLYPNGPLFRFLRDRRWDFMIVLKEGNLPKLQAMARKLWALTPHQRQTHHWGGRSQTFWWVNNLEYTWRDPETGRTRRTVVHYVSCTET